MNIQDTEAWLAYVEMRKEKGKRAPFTELAKKRVLFELRRFQADGQDIEEILWRSAVGGWAGVYAIERKGWQAQSSTMPSKAVEMTQEWIRKHNTPIEREESTRLGISARLKAARAKIMGAIDV